MSLKPVNVENVVASMRGIGEALPDEPADALAALSFVIAGLAVGAGVSLADVHKGVEIAFRSHATARKGLS